MDNTVNKRKLPSFKLLNQIAALVVLIEGEDSKTIQSKLRDRLHSIVESKYVKSAHKKYKKQVDSLIDITVESIAEYCVVYNHRVAIKMQGRVETDFLGMLFEQICEDVKPILIEFYQY